MLRGAYVRRNILEALPSYLVLPQMVKYSQDIVYQFLKTKMAAVAIVNFGHCVIFKVIDVF